MPNEYNAPISIENLEAAWSNKPSHTIDKIPRGPGMHCVTQKDYVSLGTFSTSARFSKGKRPENPQTKSKSGRSYNLNRPRYQYSIIKEQKKGAKVVFPFD